jgi:acyl transferase domain-containing protein
VTYGCIVYTANGYTRSEAVCVVFLQKAHNAKRVYATLVHAKTNCDGYKEQGITYPSGQMQKALLEEFYQECQINPAVLDYVEAHGTGTKVQSDQVFRYTFSLAIHFVFIAHYKNSFSNMV